MAESFSRQKSRHAPQKEGGLKILCDLPSVLLLLLLSSFCVTPAGTSNELDVQNGWEENTNTTHTHSRRGKPSGMAESFSREKLRHASQKEGG